MKTGHKIALIVFLSIIAAVVLIFGISIFNVMARKAQTATVINDYGFNMNYFYVAALVGGIVGGYALYRRDLKNREKGQEISLSTKSKRDS